jgi:glycosyltransferase involved in cell wall biosynthesis
VVDDGSTDGSVAVARTFSDVRVIEQRHAGPGAARNRGIAAAHGEALAFLDADDLMPAERLERQLAHLRAHPDVDCVLGRQELFGETADGSPPAWVPAGSLQPLSLLARRTAVDAVGEFATGIGEDLDWLCRIWEAGLRVDTIDSVVVRRRVHDANLSHDLGGSRRAMFKALKDHAARTRASLVSMVIPVFNGERFLAAAIRSVLDQTYRPVEVLVVDDGSTDGSVAVAGSFPEVRVIEQAHGGPAVARNRGVAAARGAFLAFLDADDLLPPKKLELQMGHLREHPEVGCVLGRQELLLEPGLAMPPWAGTSRREAPLMSMVLRAPLFAAAGGFDPTYVHGEDADFLLRIRQLVPVATLESVVLSRRIHAGNLSHDVRALRRGTFRVLRDHMRRRRADGTATSGS